MKNYQIYIKSHAEAPDYEQIIHARNLKEAIDNFYEILEGEFDRDFIAENIEEL